MRNILFPLLFLLLLSCGRKHLNETEFNSDYLDKEIADRELIISKDTAFSAELNNITKEINNLKLLTIDVENLSASINKSNSYFAEASLKYRVDTSGFVKLYQGVPLIDIVNIIKKNHLNLLNKIIISRNKNGALMYTAQ